MLLLLLLRVRVLGIRPGVLCRGYRGVVVVILKHLLLNLRGCEARGRLGVQQDPGDRKQGEGGVSGRFSEDVVAHEGLAEVLFDLVPREVVSEEDRVRRACTVAFRVAPPPRARRCSGLLWSLILLPSLNCRWQLGPINVKHDDVTLVG